MTTFNVMSGGRSQVLVDEQQLKQIQAELQRRGLELERLKASMETLNAVNVPAHFMAAAMALCNELASRWGAERVGIGFLQGRYVRLRALSHTEKITRNMQLVQDIEGAMEECLDQDVEVIIPPPKEASFVYRMAEVLSNRHGPSAVISLPLRRERVAVKERHDERFGNVVAVCTIERKADKPFTLQEIEALRLTCDLFTSRLVDLYEHDRWVGAKAARSVRRGLSWVVGAKHTWAKLLAIGVSAFIAFALLKYSMYRVDAPFTIAAVEMQYLQSPMDSRIETVNVDINDMVFSEETAAKFDELADVSPLVAPPIPHPPTVLATLNTDRLEDERIRAQGQVAELEKRIDAARADDTKRAEVGIMEVNLAQAHSEVAMLDRQIALATIKSVLDGRVFQGDLRTKLGGAVKPQDLLFVVGQTQLRAELNVPEDEISEVRVGQRGALRTTSRPDHPVRFTVERINPIASSMGGKNVFTVRVALNPEDLRGMNLSPGVEGLGKIDIRQEKLAWIWTHRMINWVRMKLWM